MLRTNISLRFLGRWLNCKIQRRWNHEWHKSTESMIDAQRCYARSIDRGITRNFFRSWMTFRGLNKEMSDINKDSSIVRNVNFAIRDRWFCDTPSVASLMLFYIFGWTKKWDTLTMITKSDNIRTKSWLKHRNVRKSFDGTAMSEK